jgi:hypothetical protein
VEKGSSDWKDCAQILKKKICITSVFLQDILQNTYKYNLIVVF